MHEALRIPEIFSHICAFADERTLARLARCCSRFQEPANIVLWESPTNILPLIRCFPSDVWCVVESREGSAELTFMRLPAPADWHRFLHYSRYVRHLSTYMRGETVSLHREVLWLMAALRPTVELFPNLKTLSWCGEKGVLECEHLPTFLPLTGTSLQAVTVYSWPLHLDHKMILQTSLALLASRSPQVQRVSIRFRSRNHHPLAPVILPLKTLPSGLTNLKIFTYKGSALGEHSFEVLAGLRGLRTLKVELPHGLPWSAARIPLHPFPSLKKLSLATTLRSYTSFSALLALPNVEDLSLQLKGSTDEHALGLLAASVRRQFSISTLSHIHITHDQPMGRGSAEISVGSSHYIRPFLQFRDVVRFSYRPPFKLSLDDCLLVDMARAWPKIRDLCIVCADPGVVKHPSLPSLHALPHIAAHCPDLSKLALTVNADCSLHLLDVEEVLQPGARMSTFMSMEVVASPINNPGHVAKYLGHVFPHIRSLLVSEFPDTDQGRTWRMGWEEVRRYLPLFAN
ncbi:hypothetical protein C8T65DRAFT_606926 [Cerioporus squamosus]|nr:hypothetical protein C8T65DRAFT_606926 [Cerioporus squamosus]